MKEKVSINKIDKIAINRYEIIQEDLNIQNKYKSNNFTWKGQFSPQFVENILKKYSEGDFVVLDPFSGSGTVLSECINMNLSCIGVELNPAAYYMSSFYEISNIDEISKNKIFCELNEELLQINNGKDLKEYWIKNKDAEKVKKNIISLFIVLLDIYKYEINNERVNEIWKRILNLKEQIKMTSKKVIALNGDIRLVNIEEDSVDLILTSPPYLNVFNYHQNYRKSVEFLGFEVLKIAKSEFGSNRKNRGNRYLTVIQYFIDMSSTINKISKVLKDDSRMIFVIGRQSKILGVDFCNSEIIYRICEELFGIKICLRQERFYKNRFGKIIYEDILHFNNRKNNLEENEIVEKAKVLAEDYLSRYTEKCSTIEEKNLILLKRAIDNIDKVKESELLC